MTFEEVWKAVDELGVLPNTAIDQIPEILTDSIKYQLLELDPQTVARIIDEAVEEVNCGSVESVNALVVKRIIGNDL